MYRCLKCHGECEYETVKTVSHDEFGSFNEYEIVSACCRGEIEVDRQLATDTVYEAIRKGHSAYGKSSEELLEHLLDVIINTPNGRELAERCYDMKDTRDACEQLADKFLGD